jgi:hypothetical protein
MNLPASVWGDLRPMLERIQNDFNREAVFYEGNKASKETIIYAALQKIEQYYKCGFRKPQSKRLIYVFPDRRNTSELRNIAS